jgi:large subunit ribosomal protein L24
MKFKVGDQIIITGGKDKGKKGTIARVLPADNKVVVEGINIYVKHRKPMGDQAGQRLELPRPLPTAKVAILNDKGQVDRIAYQVSKDGQKTRIFKKTGEVIKYAKEAKK